MNKTFFQIILILTLFVFAAALVIVFAYNETADKISQREQAAKESSLNAVLSQGSIAVEDSVEGFGTYWKELNAAGEIIGLAFIGHARGYSSIINFFCGLDLDGKVKGLSIISQNETPGLGTRIVEVVSDARFPFGLWEKQEEKAPWFCEQCKGVSAVGKIHLSKDGEWHTLSKDLKDKLLKDNQITVITGSTITTAAITNELSAKAKLLKSLAIVEKEEEYDEDIEIEETHEDEEYAEDIHD